MRLGIMVAGTALLSFGLKAQISSTTTLASVTPAAPVFGQKVSFVATVTPAAAIGSVAFMDGGVLLGVGNVIGGVARMDTITVPVGMHSLRAAYGGGGSGTYLPSQSTTSTYAVAAGNGAGFLATSSPATGIHPFGMAVGDFNGDGRADLAVSNAGSNTVTILLGNSNGTFTAAASPATGSNPIGVAVADFNGDGKADLAVVNENDMTVSILLGNGDGTFVAGASPFTGSTPESVAVGDFNGDGKADLAVANYGSNTLSIWLGNGNGTFVAAASVGVGIGPSYVAVGDFNADGKADLAVANYGFKFEAAGSMTILLGNGNGTFTAAASPVTGSNPVGVAVGDFNGDGRMDLAVANEGGDTVSILLGNGNGTFVTAAVPATGFYPDSVAVGDFNGDGKADLAVANYASNTVSILLGNGSGTFVASTSPSTGSHPSSVAVGDFNGDGRTDLAVANGDSSTASILLATAAIPLPSTSLSLVTSPDPSRYGQAVTLTVDITPSTASGFVEFLDGTAVVAAATLNLSGRAQTSTSLLASGARPLVARYAGVPGFWGGSQSIVATQTVTPVSESGFAAAASPGTGNAPYSVAAGDFNGDGKADLAVANYGGTTLTILLGNGNGTFAAAASPGTGANPVSVAVGDFNGDGKTDLAVANDGGNTVSILLGNGDGTFAAAPSPGTGSNPVSVAVGDFNGDGKADLAVANYFSNTVSILLGNGGGTFTALPSPGTGTNPYSVAVGDFNGDGKADLAVANQGSNTVSVLLGNGNGTFLAAASPAVGSTPYSVAVGDFNGDGMADLAVANYGSNTVSILLGNGNGTFAAAASVGAGIGPSSVAVGDFNGDGKADLAVSDYFLSPVTIMLGNGNGTFAAAALPGTGGSPTSVAMGDFNGDGRVDLAVANFGGNTVSILLGVSSSAVTITSLPSGTAISVTGGGCAPGTYITPASLTWTSQTSCSVAFADPQTIGGIKYAFQSSTVNGSASSHTNPLIVNSGPASLTINAIYSAVTGTSSGTATHFSVTPVFFSATTGVPLQFTVTALDASNSPVAGYSDPVHFSSSDGSAFLPADATLTNGVGSFTASLVSPGGKTITASDLFSPSITGTSGSITVSAVSGLRFVPITPCRIVDTRTGNGGFTGPIGGGATQNFNPQGSCGIPGTAQAYSLNVAVVPVTTLGFLTAWPAGQTRPVAATLNSLDGRIKSNAAIVPAGTGGAISFFASDATQLILDINGYFVPNATPGALAFYPVTPCRLVDTRNGTLLSGAFGAGTTRTLPILSSTCNVPSAAQAYSLNFVAVTSTPVGFLTAFPTGGTRPVAATLNDLTGTIAANAAIVPAGTGGSIDVYASDGTQLVVDINGYFAPAGAGGLSLYSLTPCRVLDTRQPPGSPRFTGQLDVNMLGSGCGGTPQAQAYVVNATVVPQASFGFLTLWPQGITRPVVATLNALDGAITNDMAIVPTNNTEISVFGSDLTHLILDMSGYFAP